MELLERIRDCRRDIFRDTSLQHWYVRRFHQKARLRLWRVWQRSAACQSSWPEEDDASLNESQSKSEAAGESYGIITEVIAMTECEKQVVWKGGEVRVLTAVTGVTAEPVVGPCRVKTIVVLATPLSPQDVYFVFTCLQGNKSRCDVSSWRTLRCGSLPAAATPTAALRLSLFCGNNLARPLIVIHPSCAPVYKSEIRISITRALRQRDWWVSHRIPSVSYPSLWCSSEKWTLSSAMIRFSLHISI